MFANRTLPIPTSVAAVPRSLTTARPGQKKHSRSVSRATPIAYAEEATSSNAAREGEEVGGAAGLSEERIQEDAAQSMLEYAQMKQQLLGRAQRGGGFVTIYLFLQQGLVAGGCSIIGSLVGYAYLRLMMREVDAYTADTNVPLTSARQVQRQPLRALAIGFAAYRQILTPRLLLPLGLGGLVFAVNSTQQAENFSGLQEFDMLIGFLFTYKAGLFLKLYDDMKPKFGKDADKRPERPTLAALPDIEEDRMERLLRERQRH